MEFAAIARLLDCEEHVLCIHSALLSRSGRGIAIVGPSLAGKTSTVIQAVTLGITIAANAFGPALLPFLEILFRITLIATLFSAWGYLRRGKAMLPARR